MAGVARTLQVHYAGRWHDAALVSLAEPDAGRFGRTEVAYLADYVLATEGGFGPQDVADHRALSVRYPVDLSYRATPTWPAFLVDLLPQGAGRKGIRAHLGLTGQDREDDGAELQLLSFAAGAPIGNIRLREAAAEAAARQPVSPLTDDQVLAGGDELNEAMQHSFAFAPGATSAQGDWPKILLTRRRDGMWQPDQLVEDADAVAHVLIKRLRASDDASRIILDAEPPLLELARDFGLRVAGRLRQGRGLLVVPRFDREVLDGTVVRHGQESLVSAIGIVASAYQARHETYLAAIRDACTDPQAEVLEYILRDALNHACGNTDNHGRNTALQKTARTGSVHLTPVFDFAPMRLSSDPIPRQTTWACMGNLGAGIPDWNRVGDVVDDLGLDPRPVLRCLRDKAACVRTIAARGMAKGIPPEAAPGIFVHAAAVVDALAAIRLPDDGPATGRGAPR